jgi:hypothetical protein
MSERERSRLSEGVLAELRAVDVGLLPEDLFIELARLTVLSTVEVVCLRQGAAGIEVLLTQRAETDPFWAGQWHSPGSVIRPQDPLCSFVGAFKRILSGELGLTEWAEPVFVGPCFWNGDRGAVVSQVHWLDVTNVSMPTGTFYPWRLCRKTPLSTWTKLLIWPPTRTSAALR